MTNLVNTQAEEIDRTRRNLNYTDDDEGAPTMTLTTRQRWSTRLYNEDDVKWTLA